MGGGLMQLVAYGAQDIYLTGNPQITFFKVVYRRHTNFSMESIAQSLDGTPGFGNTVDCTISRTGDLVHKVYVKLVLTCKSVSNTTYAKNKQYSGIIAICDNIGSSCMKQMDLEIGGQLIDRHYGHWLETWAKLSEPSLGEWSAPMVEGTNENTVAVDSQWTNYEVPDIVNDATVFTQIDNIRCRDINLFRATTGYGGVSGLLSVSETNNMAFRPLYIPLQFWFCRNPGLALPLIALQYHEVKLKLTFEEMSKINNNTTSTDAIFTADSNLDAEVLVDYIYLDTDERRRFAQVSHEYLIEQLQFQNSSESTKHELVFNHPCKELIWGGVPNSTATAQTATAYAYRSPSTLTQLYGHQAKGGKGTGSSDFFPKFRLTLNGHDRISEREYEYFTRTQILQHHSGLGGSGSSGRPASENTSQGGQIGCTSKRNDSIAVYSFALKPEEHQPSGTCNFSRIDNAELISDKSQALYIYAVNYNVLRIMSGMGGLAYSN